MRPETLQSFSVGIVFVGFFLAALGGFGTFYFGHRLDREQEQQRAAVVQHFAQIVSALREEQRGLIGRVATVEERVAAAASPRMAATNPPPERVLRTDRAPARAEEEFLLLAKPPPSSPDILLPHLPTIAQGPPPAGEVEGPRSPPPQPPPSAIEPPKMRLSKLAAQAPASVAHDDEEGLSGEKRSHLIKGLRSCTGQDFVIRAAAGNARAMKLAADLKSAFREAGWTVGDIEWVTRQLPANTLLISAGVFPPPKEFVAAYAGLAATGFLVTNDLDPNQSRKRVVVSVGPIR